MVVIPISRGFNHMQKLSNKKFNGVKIIDLNFSLLFFQDLAGIIYKRLLKILKIQPLITRSQENRMDRTFWNNKVRPLSVKMQNHCMSQCSMKLTKELPFSNAFKIRLNLVMDWALLDMGISQVTSILI